MSDTSAHQAPRHLHPEPRPERRRQLARRIEASPSQAPWRRRHRHHRPAEQVSRCQPLDPVRHQLRHRQQVAELQGADQRSRDAVVGGRAPDPVHALRARRQDRRRRRQPSRAPRTQHRLCPAAAPARRAERRRDERGGDLQDSHAPSLRGKGARVARKTSNIRDGGPGPPRVAPISTEFGGSSAPGNTITSRSLLPAPILAPSPITAGPSIRTSSPISQSGPSSTGPSRSPSSPAGSPLRKPSTISPTRSTRTAPLSASKLPSRNSVEIADVVPVGVDLVRVERHV